MRVVSLLVAAAIFSMAVSADVTKMDHIAMFTDFKKTYGRAYPTETEEARRLGIFIRNMQKAERLQSTNPHATFGVNEFADMTEEEFKVRHNGEAFYRKAVRARQSRKVAEVKGTIKQSVDWRNHGAVTAVKNQGQCGSCWSFSTTGNIEGQWALAGHTLVSLSEQELVSCDTTCNGCSGGLMDDAFSWIINANGGGLTAESQYPYNSGSGVAPACSQSGLTNVAFITSYNDIAHDENSMATQVSSGGPLSIGVDATSWQTYTGGVMTNCQSNQVDHGVLIVGYDLSSSPQYWIIKNSWGPTWGESGYIRVEYGSNQCLITTAPSTSVASGNPSPPGPPSPPSPPAPPQPTPPTPPSTGTFTQYTCTSPLCMSGCTDNSFQTGVCIPTQGGGSAIASCGSTLTLYVFTSSDCTGSYSEESIPLDTCLLDNNGSYIYDTCNAASASKELAKAGTKMHLRKH